MAYAQPGETAGGGTALAVSTPAPATDKPDETEADNLGTLVAWFEEAEDATYDARQLSERDRDYYDNDQLTAAEKKALAARGQADTINNEIKRKIDFLTGFEATKRTDPKALPRNSPNDEAAAEAATDMLRYQEQTGELDQANSAVWENMLVEGFGGVEVLGPKKANPNLIEVIHWEWDRLFYDPHSRKHDFSDARYMGGVIWMDADQAKQTFKAEKGQDFDPEAAIEATVAQEPVNSETYDDRPRQIQWARHGKRARVRIVQMYYKDGDNWHLCVFTKGGKIRSEKIELLDENGEPECPMILQSAYVNRKNERYGMVREFIGPQDGINKRTSKSLHLLTVTGGIYEEGAVDDIEAFRTEMARPDGWGKANAGALDRIRPRDAASAAQAAGNLQLLQEDKAAIREKGPNAALAGKQSESASGRAIRASQEGGIIELARLRDRHTDFKNRVYRAIWNRVRQFITEPTWVRVTDDEKKIRFVGFNRPVTFAEAAAKELEGQGVPPEEIEATVMQLAAENGVHPEQPVKVENVPAQMDMDITIEAATESVNIQEEQFAKLVELAPIVQFPPATYLKASSFRNKGELLKELEGDPEKAQVEQEAKLTQLALEFDKMRAEIQDLQAGADQKRSAAFLNAAKAGVAVQEALAPPEPNDGGTAAPQAPQQAQLAPPPGMAPPMPPGPPMPPQGGPPQPMPQAMPVQPEQSPFGFPQ
jgi:hypothetical protein